MANELIDFPRTMATLEQLAQDVKAGYIDQLEKNGHPTMYGQNRLSDTISTVVTVDGHSFTASLRMNEYWKYLEKGTAPHWPPRDAILKWVEIKPVIPRPDGNGRIPSPQQLSFLISRKISEVGTKGTHGFQTARDAIVPTYYERIEASLAGDIGDYLKAMYSW